MSKLNQPTQKTTAATRSELQYKSDEMEIIRRCQAGDPDAFEALMKRYKEPIYRFAYRLCDNHEDVNDIVSQVMFLLYSRIQTFRGESSFSSWLFRIVRNVHIDLCIRSSKNNTVSLDDPLAIDGNLIYNDIRDTSISPEEELLQKERAWSLHSAIRHLPEYQRTVMVHHADGKSHEEISQITGLPIGTIKSRLNRARASLRERLGSYQAI